VYQEQIYVLLILGFDFMRKTSFYFLYISFFQLFARVFSRNEKMLFIVWFWTAVVNCGTISHTFIWLLESQS
jgi:hypothetical protein